MLVDKLCVGGHQRVTNIRCSTAEPLCGQRCRKTLQCGRHSCPSRCHVGDCLGKYTRLAHTKRVLFEAPKSADPPSDSWGDDAGDGGEEEAVDDWEETDLATGPTEEDAHRSEEASCGLPCGTVLPCGHRCQAACHPGRSCPPSLVCLANVEARCKCGHKKSMVQCRYGDPKEMGFGGFFGGAPMHVVATAQGMAIGAGGGGARAPALAVATGKVPLSAPMAAAVSAAGPGGGGGASVPPPVAVRQLACSKRCEEHKQKLAQLERNRMLAAALDLQGADTTAAIEEPFTDTLLAAAATNAELIRSVESKLAAFIGRGAAAKQYAFPVMKSAHRQVVHELAQRYGLVSASYDPEPNRNVVVFRSELCDPRIPTKLLSKHGRPGVGPPAPSSADRRW
jgi:hypothetical protein